VHVELILFIDDLDTQLKHCRIAFLNILPQSLAVEVDILAVDHLCFVPHHLMHAVFWFPVEFDEVALPFCVYQPECMDAETFHHAEASRDGAVAHEPHHHMRTFRIYRNPVPESVVRRSCLWHFIM